MSQEKRTGPTEEAGSTDSLPGGVSSEGIGAAPVAVDLFALARERDWHLFQVDHPDALTCQGVPTAKKHDPSTCTDRGKHPVPPHWSEAASTDAQDIAAWSSGRAVNYGIACGPSRLVVIDQDRPNGLRKYAESINEKVPATYEVRTHRGRSHLYFQAPDGVEIGNPGVLKHDAGCDVRGAGGYVVGPGSKHDGGEYYTPVDPVAPVEPMPDWLIGILTAPKPAAPSGNGQVAWGLGTVEVIRGPQVDEPGERYTTLLAYSGDLRARGIPDREAAILVRQMWEQCEQPPVCLYEMTPEDAEALRVDVYARYPVGPSERGRQVNGERLARRLRSLWNGQPYSIGDAIADAWLGEELAAQGVVELPSVAAGPAAGRTGSTSGDQQLAIRRAVDMTIPPPPTWCAVGYLPFGAPTVLCGDEGIGKSLWWVLVAAHITIGAAIPEIGLPARKPRDVIIVVTEDTWAEVRARLVLAGADLSHVHPFSEDDQGNGAPEFPADIDKIYAASKDLDIALVVVDAWLDTVSDKIKVKDGQQARAALHPWKELAAVVGCAALLVVNANRMEGVSIRQRYGATMALRQKARMTLWAAAPPGEVGRAVLVGPDKTNGIQRGNATRYTISVEQVRPRTADDPGTVARLTDVEVTEQTIEKHVEAWDVAAKAADRPDGVDAKADAWLRSFMAAHHGIVLAQSGNAAAKAAGHSPTRVVSRLGALGGCSKALEFHGPYYWHLDPEPGYEPTSNAFRPTEPSKSSEPGSPRSEGSEEIEGLNAGWEVQTQTSEPASQPDVQQPWTNRVTQQESRQLELDPADDPDAEG